MEPAREPAKEPAREPIKGPATGSAKRRIQMKHVNKDADMIGVLFSKAEAEELLKVVKLYVEYDNECATNMIEALSAAPEKERDMAKYIVNNILDSITTLSDIERKLLDFLGDDS